MGSSHTLDQLDTCFDDTHAVAETADCARSIWASGPARTGPAASC